MKSRLLGDMIWLGAAQVLALLARLVGIRVLTEVLPAHIYGEMGLMLAISAFGIALFANPLIQAAMRHFADAKRNDSLAHFRSITIRIVQLSAALFALLLCVAGFLWAEYLGRSPAAVVFLLVAIFTVLDISRIYEVGILNVAHRQRVMAAWNIADAWARPFAAALVVMLAGATTTAVFIGYALAVLIVYAIFWRIAAQPVAAPSRAATDVRLHKQLIDYALPLAPVALFGWTIGVADRFVLAHQDGPASAGIYIAAYGLASAPFLALSKIFVDLFRPRLFDSHAEQNRRRIRALLTNWGLAFAAAGGAGLYLVTLLVEPLVELALAKSFSAAADLIPWVCLAYFIKGLQAIFETELLAQKRTQAMLVMQGLSAVGALISYLLLIPPYGAMGAAWGTVASFAFSLLVSAYLAYRPSTSAPMETP
ncbi:MAG: oligosaccharide flippase family protein [Pseudomonadota bacterium]